MRVHQRGLGPRTRRRVETARGQPLPAIGQRPRAVGPPPGAGAIRCGDEGTRRFRGPSPTTRPCSASRAWRGFAQAAPDGPGFLQGAPGVAGGGRLARGAIPALRRLHPGRVISPGSSACKRRPWQPYRQALALVEQMAAASPDDPEVAGLPGAGPTRGLASRSGRWAGPRGPPVLRTGPRDPGAARPRRSRDAPVPRGPLLDPLQHRRHPPGDRSSGRSDPSSPQAIAIHEDLVARHPGNAQYRSDLAWCWRYLSLALAASGDLDEALRLAERAAALLRTARRRGTTPTSSPAGGWRAASTRSAASVS